jgi:multidrug resistance efflux pump
MDKEILSKRDSISTGDLSMKIAKFFLLPTDGTPTATPIPTVLADTAIISEGRLEPVRFTEIALSASGLVSEVLVKEGDSVTAGQVIARLESPEAQTLEDAKVAAVKELNDAYEAARLAQLALDNFNVPTEFSGLTPTKAVEQTLQAVNDARAAYEPYKDYSVNNQTAREYKRRLDDAWSKYRKAIQWMELETTFEAAQARLKEAQADQAILNDPNFPETTAGRRAALANAELRAPFAGVITNQKLKVGEFASAGQPVVTIADTSSWVVKTTDLTEIDVVELTEGQPVLITLDAIPGVELKGNVLSIGQSYSQNQGDVVYEVTVLLTESNPTMRWGMTAAVKFE